MSSRALQKLSDGAAEVRDILSADPTPRGGFSPQPAITRALTRAALVMLSGHFERYLRASVEEAIEILNDGGIKRDQLPIILRLQHSRESVERLAKTSWERRAKALCEFVESEGWFWGEVSSGTLNEQRLLSVLKTPKPKKVVKLYRMWGVEDIFTRITRADHTRKHFWLRLTELVDKRNNIAHGDFMIETTGRDVYQYLNAVEEFCRRVDGVMANILRRWGLPCDW